MKLNARLSLHRATGSALLTLAVAGPVACCPGGGLGDFLNVQSNTISVKAPWEHWHKKLPPQNPVANLVPPDTIAVPFPSIPAPDAGSGNQVAAQPAAVPQASPSPQSAALPPAAAWPQPVLPQPGAPQGGVIAAAPAAAAPSQTPVTELSLAQPVAPGPTVPVLAGTGSSTPALAVSGVGAQYAFLADGSLLLCPPGDSAYGFWYEHFAGKPPVNNREAWMFVEGILGQSSGTTSEILLQTGIGLNHVKLANEFERRDYHDRMLPVYRAELDHVARFGAVQFVMYGNVGTYDFRSASFPCDLHALFYPWAEGQRFNLSRVEVAEPVARRFKGANNNIISVVVLAQGRLMPGHDLRPEAVGRSIELLRAKVYLVAWQPLRHGAMDVVDQLQLKELTFR